MQKTTSDSSSNTVFCKTKTALISIHLFSSKSNKLSNFGLSYLERPRSYAARQKII